MIVTDTLIPLVTPPPMTDQDGTQVSRSPGVHLTTITRYIAKQSGLLKVETQRFVGKDVLISDEEEDRLEEKRKLGLSPSQKIPLRMALGMAWEEWAAHLYPDMVWQPGEMSLEGVAMTPDGVTERTKTQPLTVDEFKCTYKSSLVKGSPRDIRMEWLWLAQVKAYCLCLRTLGARVHVLYVNGGYRFGEGEVPEYRVYGVQFTRQELEANWGLVMRNKEKAWREEKAEMKNKASGGRRKK